MWSRFALKSGRPISLRDRGVTIAIISAARPSPFRDGFDLVHGELTEQQNIEDNSFYLQNREMKFGKRFWAGKHHTLSTAVNFYLTDLPSATLACGKDPRNWTRDQARDRATTCTWKKGPVDSVLI